jgi:UDP-N-acetylmuramoyl-L-alanyl-D-glutamate--2,6-diaminopimelate ligase
MKLSALLRALEPGLIVARDPEVTGLAYDSRRARPGYAFVAVAGAHTDGHRHVADAVARGAVAIVAQHPVETGGAVLVPVADTRAALALLAAAFYGHPSRELALVGVTGTDGKTTTTILLHSILQAAGWKAGALSTVDQRMGELVQRNRSRQTTPEALEIQEELATLRAAGARAAVLETSSHALVLERVRGCAFDVAILTNLSHEHLDFHQTFEAYRDAKLSLFAMLADSPDKGFGKCAVLNRDDPAYDYFQARVPTRALTYGEVLDADLMARAVEEGPDSLRFELHGAGAAFPVQLRLAGRWNVMNALAAAAGALALGIPPEAIRQGLERLEHVPGRMERVDLGQPFRVMIDYAHTPQSLEKVLRALRPLTPGRLCALFGSAGERDRDKRPWMGEIAARLADYAVLTNEDPREEDPEAILAEIAAGALACGKVEGKDFVRIADRRKAIAHALRWAKPDDTILLAGKGHENCIIIGREAVPYDEREAVEAALLKLAAKPAGA